MEIRVGQGVDVHRWVDGRPLLLGGVPIPHHQGLLGHSDADVLIHALVDALLGALGRGDIGRLFPDTDPRYAGADSRLFLKAVKELLDQDGWTIANLDSTVICQQPKLAPHIPVIQASLAAILEITPQQVGVKATTTEKLGFTGRNEGVAAMAVALLIRTTRS